VKAVFALRNLAKQSSNSSGDGCRLGKENPIQQQYNVYHQ